jgi:hypothetical protein
VTADDVDFKGAVQFYGGFWHQVLLDLHHEPRIAPGRREHQPAAEIIARAQALAWVLDDALTYDSLGLPVSFRAWCRFGNMNLDPAWLREHLLSGELPGFVKYEGE